MIQLEIDGERYPIAAGETVIGSATDNKVVLEGAGIRPRHAVVQGMPAGAAIRTADSEAEVLVNGVRLGSDPTPLLHGDKIGIGAHELLVVDPTRAGSTQLFDSGAFADLAPPPGHRAAGTRTGGRLVCLTDGREYTVGAGPLTFGRDAGSDIVVAGNEVSRQHAEIRNEADGYLLLDLSVNGTYVNGERIGKTHLLARADVIRIGNDEFRFYADTAAQGASNSAASPGPPAPPAASAGPPAPPAASPPRGAAQRLSDTMHGIREVVPAERNTPSSPEAAPLASLLFRSGVAKGLRLPIKVPVVNIGRGDYNDIVIGDPSVSTMHAKLQRREAIWILTDLGSTNGTYVEGERLAGEAPLSPGTTLRFGDVIALFEPLDDNVPAGRTNQTRMLDRVVVPEPELVSKEEQSAPLRPRRPIRMVPPRPKGPSPLLVTSLLVLLAILVYLLLS
jgi:pSer/pThr/pTyr-binding forkhead associated (FHA) protein